MPVTPHNNNKDINLFRAELIEGLEQTPKVLPSHYMYDETGSKLFQKITRLPNYYLTRSELTLLKMHAHEIGDLLKGECALVEFGAGTIEKASILLSGCPNIISYTPIDITAKFDRMFFKSMAQRHPMVQFAPISGNFFNSLDLSHLTHHAKRLGLLLGATLGNLSSQKVEQFLRSSQNTLGPDAALLISIDLYHNPEVHKQAYRNDEAGIRRAFCDNLISRINSELGANIQARNFIYAAIWNPNDYSIEMSYISRLRQWITIADREFQIEPAERIIIKRSYKHPLQYALKFLAKAGYKMEKRWKAETESCQLLFLKPVKNA